MSLTLAKLHFNGDLAARYKNNNNSNPQPQLHMVLNIIFSFTFCTSVFYDAISEMIEIQRSSHIHIAIPTPLGMHHYLVINEDHIRL